MNESYQLSLFIFRRDLRVDDNTGLLEALRSSKQVIPCFIFDPRQIGSANEYRSTNAIQFMIESLQDLEQQLKQRKGSLYLFEGIAEKVLEKLIKKYSIDAVFCNRDYTPFSIKRDEAIKKICLHHEIEFIQSQDLLLTQPEEVMTQGGTPYAKFTPFFKKASLKKIATPIKCSSGNFFNKSIKESAGTDLYKKILKKKNSSLNIPGGRMHGLSIIKSLKKFKDYAKIRNAPSIATTLLSAHNKFGTLSIREVYHAIQKQLGKNHLLIQQLFWRDFFTHVAYNSPFVFGQPFQERYTNLSWNKSYKNFESWCQGKTGFPIVDAGMRQLNETGFMHNRVRMIVASFLTKDLHINWLWGEKYFAQQLEDYDPAVNNGNWQWCASTGCDAQPYFRIFNPWLQQKKFDPDCTYIKTWIPELKKVKPSLIHTWFKKTSPSIKNYPRPILDHSQEAALAKKMYRKA
ncbi:MAG: deoxyribodipyrimidine photo-lyase [Candidatus Babeliales bacterium]